MADPVVISAFEGEWAALSNFHVGEPLVFRKREYASGEHLFQAFKATTVRDHETIRLSATPGEAKANGRHLLRLRGDWERVKLDVMRVVLATKFRLEREEGPILLATGDALLVEGNMWGDQTWGVNLKAGRKRWHEISQVDEADASWMPGEGWEHAPGRNWLGTLLMARRGELYAQQRGTLTLDYRETARVAMELPPRS